MNNPETMARLIKSIMKQNGISNKELSDNVQKVNVNTISQLSNGREVSYVILANIAEYLGCSVDYLLGRTITPNGTYSISGNNVQAINGNNSYISVSGNAKTNEDATELVSLIQSLPLIKRAEAILYLNNLKNEK